MTAAAASATPQQMRDRLLAAIDGQSNQICNMVAVMEVISYLEKFPITKETLEETRLGKLINDVRKKTKDEDLAKRAKKLLRNWQKLIEPGQSEASTKGAGHVTAVPGSANGATYPSPTAAPPSTKTVPELKSRNDFNNCYSPQVEKPTGRKRKADQRGAQRQQPPAKISKTTSYEKVQNSSSRPPTNGLRGGPEVFSDALDAPSEFAGEHLDNDRLNKIPVNAVKPHPSSQGLSKTPSTSALLKAAVLQQARLEQASVGQYLPKSPRSRLEPTGTAGQYLPKSPRSRLEPTGAGQYLPKSPRSSSHSPRISKQETVAKQPALSASKVSTLSSPARSPAFAESSGPGRSPPLPSPQPPSTLCVSALHPDEPHPADHPLRWETPADTGDPCLEHSSRGSESPIRNSPHNSKASPRVRTERDDSVNITGRKKRKKYRPRDYTVNLDGQQAEESTKPVRLKDRRLTFDPVTGQIKPLSHKEPNPETDIAPPPEPQRTDAPPTQGPSAQSQNPPVAVAPSPFQQTNWKELSRNEIIQSYLNRQSNVLTSSGSQTSGAHFFMTEYLKQEEDHVKEARKTHVMMAPDLPDLDLPGVSRELTDADLDRIHTERWPGVNGCYDTKDKWYDWTECISLDPYGDESKLNILPYISLD